MKTLKCINFDNFRNFAPVLEIPNNEIKLPSKNTILYSKKSNKTSIRKKFRLAIFFKLCHSNLCKKISKEAEKISQMDEILNKWMSYQNIFKTLLQFERFKNLQMDSEQLKFFHSLNLYNFENLKYIDEQIFLQEEDYMKIVQNQDESFIKRLKEF